MDLEDCMSKERVYALAKRGFEAYNATGPNPGLAHDGKRVPGWDEIAPEKRDQIHGKWAAATEKIAGEVIGEMVRLLKRGLRPDELEDHLREHFSASEAPAITYSGDA
jgi:hypothetical protein